MSIRDEIEKLPETLPSTEIAKYFSRVLELSKNTLQEKEVICHILFELSDKQWHNYEKASEPIIKEIEDFINSLLIGELSLDLISSITGIIGRLGLEKSYDLYKTLSNKNLPQSILKYMKRAIKEYSESVCDPYHE